MSDDGSSEAQAATGATEAHDAGLRAARAGAEINYANAARARKAAADLSTMRRTAAAAAVMAAAAAKFARIGAVYEHIASKVAQSKSSFQNGGRE